MLKTRDERRCFVRESSSTSGIISVNLVKSWRTVQDYEKGTSVTQIKIGYCYPIYHNPILSLLVTYHRVYSKINTTGATRGEGTAYLSGTYPVLVEVAWLDLYFSVLVFFLSTPLHCLSFFNLRLLIIPLVSKWYFQFKALDILRLSSFINKILIGITNSGISNQPEDIYSVCICYCNGTSYKRKLNSCLPENFVQYRHWWSIYGHRSRYYNKPWSICCNFHINFNVIDIVINICSERASSI